MTLCRHTVMPPHLMMKLNKNKPDLLNFKKGWMTKLYADEMWKKHWFVLTDQSLRFYKDSIAEEASDVDGEIDLSTCYDVTEFPVQRNYGFQILSNKEGAWTLSAMTSGIRRNWIQAIMKNVRPTIAPPDVTRSHPDEKANARVVLERCPQPSPEPPAAGPEAPRVDGHTQRTTGSSAPPASEPRKGRVRERRRDGRSKTYDWSDFKAEEEPRGDGAEDTVGLGSASSSSTTTTSSSSCSSTSSPASSPNSATSSPQTSSSSVSERRHVLQRAPPRGATHASNTVTVTLTATLNASHGVVHPRVPEPQDPGKMEVDPPGAVNPDPPAAVNPDPEGGGGQKGGDRVPDVQVEIEQRWHQVETTPLREEKQVPIASTAGSPADRLPPLELAAILDKELGQKQRELLRLQEENGLLQGKLEDARGREHSAREGYVLQSATPPSSSSSSSPHRVPRQRLHQLDQDLQGESEAQKPKQDQAHQQAQTLRRSFTDARDTVGRHEAEVQALQAKLTAAMAEILAGEEAVARMRNELRLEQERSREREEERACGELTLRHQLRDNEDRLREVEASLLERSQALRHLERQQALQRDHLREIQRLQERLQEVTARLSATEEGQALKEERLRNEQRCMQESHEQERQCLGQRLAEAEAGQKEMEDRLLEAEQQVEALLRGRPESREELLRLQEKLSQRTDMVETLRESVRRLEEEKGRLACRCQELINQIAEADREVNKLRSRLETEEADYYTLEHSYEKASEEFQRMSQFLREKEEEIRQTKEMYERLVERKEEDLKEALVKMAALGNSLEETEQKLQAKEELLCQMSLGLLSQGEPCSAERDLQAKLVVAEDRIAELEQHLNALQLGYADLRVERQRVQEEALHTRDVVLKERVETSASIQTNTESLLSSEMTCKTKSSPGREESQAKRQRIRFSSIQCQKHTDPEGLDTGLVDGTSLDTGLEISPVMSQVCRRPSEGTSSSDITFQYCSDPEKFISIIHALETKLLATEDKLRNLTQKLEEQRAVQPGDPSLSDLQGLDDGPPQEEVPSSGSGCQIRAANGQYAMALACVEMSREKVRAILSGYDQGSTDSQLHSLSEIEKELVNATQYIRRGEKTLEEHNAPDIHENRTQEKPHRKDVDEETIQLFAKTLSFEAIVLNKMALLIQNPKSDLLQGLGEICEELESIKRGDGDCLAIVYADVLTRKLMLESAFWREVEKAEAQCDVLQRESSDVGKGLAEADAGACIAIDTSIRAELKRSIENLQHFYEEKFRVLKGELTEARSNLQRRESALNKIFQAFERPDLENVIKGLCTKFDFSQRQTLADISPPDLAHFVVQRLADVTPAELAPYMEQIESEEARDLAEDIIDGHLAGDLPSCSIDSIESMHIGQENLAVELQRQAVTLHRFAQEIESGSSNYPGLADMICTLTGPQTSYSFRSGSLCMREALIQAQVAYVACRLRANHEQDLGRCQRARQNMELLVQEHAHSVGTIRQCYEASLQDERLSFTQTVTALQEENQSLKGEVGQRVEQLSQQQQQLAHLEELFQRETEDLRQRHALELTQAERSRSSTELVLMETTADGQRKLEVLLVDMDTMEERHKGHVRELEERFQERIREFRQIHEEEIQRLHAHYMNTVRGLQEERREKSSEISRSLQCDEVTAQTWPMEEEEQGKGDAVRARSEAMTILKDRIQELETQMDTMREELETQNLEGEVAGLREKHQRDFESLKATCERGFATMEDTHHRVLEDLQRQHQREVARLLEERERLLEEETAATIAAIEAMKNAHREELEKNHRSPLSGLNSDVDELRLQYEEELQSIHRELEVLSEQYSQKCLENAHLAQALEAERQALRQCQRENQDLNSHNQELNNRLTEEITRMRSCFSGEMALSPLTQGKDLYELEVLLRIKESEIQYLKQEIHSLKDELQAALRDKKYATDRYKDIYTELSITKAKADCDIGKLQEKLLSATEALGEKSADAAVTPGYDIMKSKSNPDFLKKERSMLTKQIRGLRSKSVTEQVSWDS